MAKPQIIVPVVLTLSAGAGLAGSLLYWLWKRQQTSGKRNISDILKKRMAKVEINVPAFAVPLLIGKRGEVIQAIEEQTETKIIFKGSVVNRKCVIYGLIEDVPLAKNLILETIKDLPFVQSVDLWLPEAVFAKITERNTLKSLTWNSRARIIVDKEKLKQPTGSPKKVILQGTPQQLAIAQALLQDKITDLESQQEKLQSSFSDSQLSFLSSKSVTATNGKNYEIEPLVAVDSDGFAETYVCAVVDPSQFYVQLIGPHAALLDKLVQDMTDFYEQDHNKDSHTLPLNVQNGDIIAAKFSHDGSWYRAKVQSVDSNSGGKLELFFVDFGDVETCSDRRNVCQLASEFQSLKFQAIECSLANIGPKNGTWSEECITRFEELVYNAQWKVIMTRVLGYRNHVPLVELVDTSGPEDVNVAFTLVEESCADWIPS